MIKIFKSYTTHTLSSHIYQPMMDSLSFLARYLGNGDQRKELLLRSLQLFIQQGIRAKKASDSAQSSHKVCLSLGHVISASIM